MHQVPALATKLVNLATSVQAIVQGSGASNSTISVAVNQLFSQIAGDINSTTIDFQNVSYVSDVLQRTLNTSGINVNPLKVNNIATTA